ncbi:HAD family hydrolase [Tenacibaculum ovolyticum]|uniref:HAD family hydrolase n=1 Tax=Tenacibaculum ovolyticum TaxID=104270 RepID=UPI003BA95DE1
MLLKKQYKGIIFDLDGTLLNTLGTYSYIMNELLRKNNFPIHTMKDYSGFIGNGAKNFITLSIPIKDRNEEFITHLLHDFHLQYENLYTQHSELYVGMMDLLIDLQSSGIKLALLSNKLHHLTQKCVNHFLPNIKFSHVIGQSDKYKKPDPIGVLDLSKLLKISLDDLVFIGDTEVDIMTAKNSGVDSIAVTWGFRDEKELIATSPNYVVNKPVELMELLQFSK